MAKNIIFIVAIKNLEFPTRSESYDYCIDSWKQWARKNNSDVFLLEEAIHPLAEMNPCWHKLYIFDLLEANEIEYDQILVVDADTIVHPNCPNFFEMTDNKFTAVRAVGSMDWICRSMENYSKFLFDDKKFDIFKYFNSGFIIINKSHKYIMKFLLQTYLDNKDAILAVQNKFHVGTDQPMMNFIIHLSNIDVKFLPYEYNMQDLARSEILTDEFIFTKIGWIYHFNAIPNNYDYKLTNWWMKETYEHLFKNKLES